MPLLSKLLPLLLLILLAAIATFVAYAIYSICTDVANTTHKKMEEKNVSFSKDGMKVGVKGVGNENYVDRTQRYGLCLCCLATLYLPWADGRVMGAQRKAIGEGWLMLGAWV